MFDKDQLSDEEKAIIGKCGVYCPACDAFIGKAKEYAKKNL
jgi:hypothetical protein